jgi:hypothetical protein
LIDDIKVILEGGSRNGTEIFTQDLDESLKEGECKEGVHYMPFPMYSVSPYSLLCG